MNQNHDPWENFLNPEVLKPFLLLSSIFNVSFEILKNTIIRKVSSFFTDYFTDDGPKLSEEYKEEVLSLGKGILISSMKWHKQMGIINDDDIETYHKLRITRNSLAHEVIENLEKPDFIDFHPLFNDLIALLHKIELWWLKNYEMELMFDEDTDSFDFDGFTPCSIMIIQLMLDIAFQDKEDSEFYYKQYMAIKNLNTKTPRCDTDTPKRKYKTRIE